MFFLFLLKTLIEGTHCEYPQYIENNIYPCKSRKENPQKLKFSYIKWVLPGSASHRLDKHQTGKKSQHKVTLEGLQGQTIQQFSQEQKRLKIIL